MASSGWHKVRLGDLLSIKHGWPFKSELFSEELTGRPIVVAVGNFQYTGGFRFESTNVKEYRGDYPKEYELEPGDVLLVMTCQTAGGEILGIPGKIPDDGRVYLHNQRLGKVVINRPDVVTIDYLYWLFLWRDFNQELVASSSGTKIVHTAPSRIESFKFAIPPLDDQRAIARILSALDNKIELNRQMTRTLEAMAQALFKSWFVDFDPVTAKAAGRKPCGMSEESAALFPDHFVESELGLIPEGWLAGKVADICTTQYGYTASATSTDTGVRLLRVTDINKTAWIEWDNVPFCDIEKKLLPRYQLKIGDILVSRMADPGKAAIVEKPISAVFASYLVRLTTSEEKSYYLFYFLRSDDYKAYAEGATSGTVQENMNARVITASPMVIPSQKISSLFQKAVQPLRKKIVGNIDENSTLVALRDTLLPKLLSGDIPIRQAENLAAEAV